MYYLKFSDSKLGFEAENHNLKVDIKNLQWKFPKNLEKLDSFRIQVKKGDPSQFDEWRRHFGNQMNKNRSLQLEKGEVVTFSEYRWIERLQSLLITEKFMTASRKTWEFIQPYTTESVMRAKKRKIVTCHAYENQLSPKDQDFCDWWETGNIILIRKCELGWISKITITHCKFGIVVILGENGKPNIFWNSLQLQNVVGKVQGNWSTERMLASAMKNLSSERALKRRNQRACSLNQPRNNRKSSCIGTPDRRVFSHRTHRSTDKKIMNKNERSGSSWSDCGSTGQKVTGTRGPVPGAWSHRPAGRQLLRVVLLGTWETQVWV